MNVRGPIKNAIERFHLARIYANLIGTKKCIYMRKELNSPRIFLVHQHGRRFIILEHQYGRRDVTWKRSIRAEQQKSHQWQTLESYLMSDAIILIRIFIVNI